MSYFLPRPTYARMFGPTTGDRLRLADTSLILRVERDYTVYGEEVKFGGGKTIRDGMAQSARDGVLDLVVTNASSSIIGASSRPISACAMAVSSRWARPATPTPWTASTPTW